MAVGQCRVVGGRGGGSGGIWVVEIGGIGARGG